MATLASEETREIENSAPDHQLRPAVSVVVPVLNEAEDIPRLLGELQDQEPPAGGFEVLVVDGGSDDRTREIVRSFSREHPHFHLLDNPRRLSSAGRNVGARASRGRFVVYIDGHCSLPRRDYLIRTVDLFEFTQADCLCRPQPLNQIVEGEWSRAISMARHSWFGHKSGSDIYGNKEGFTDPRSAGAAYRREVFGRIGDYDERFDACEDVEFNHRVASAGLRSYRHPDLAIHYRPRSSLRGLFRQMFRYGRGRARLMARHPKAFPVPLVLLTLGALMLCGLLFLNSGLAAAVVILLGSAWCLTATLESIRLGGGASAHRIFIAFVAIHAGLLIGFWRGIPEFPLYRGSGIQSARA